jgi:hypothetical protein
MGCFFASSATSVNSPGSTRTTGHDETGLDFFRGDAIEISMYTL